MDKPVDRYERRRRKRNVEKERRGERV